MDWNELVKNNRIEIIKAFFESGVQNTVEKCRKDFMLARPFTVPIPIAYWGYDDFRSLKDKMFEDFCCANIIAAFQMAQPIRDRIDFYDLICCAMPQTGDEEKQKYIYTEIIKFTKSENIRDYYVEKLYILNLHNEVRNNCKIDSSIYPYLLNKEKTIKGLDILINGCDMPYNPYRISNVVIKEETHKEIELTITGDCQPYEPKTKQMEYINKDVRFRFHELECFSIRSSETALIRFYPTNKIQEHADTLTFTCGNAIKVEAKKMEVISIHENTELYTEEELEKQ